jgi:hypothetical protein
MKKNFLFASFIILSIITSLTNCKQESVEETLKTTSNHKISKSVTESQSSNNLFKEESIITYQYDNNGNLTKKSMVNDGQTKAYYVQDETYTYNSEGNLMEQAFVGINDEPNIPVRKSSTKSKFTYSNGKLLTIEKSSTNPQGNVSLENTKYFYGGDGVLNSQVRTNQIGTTFTSTYNEKGELIDYVIKTNSETTRPYTLQNGLVMKETGKGYFVNYIYNEKRQIIKSEVYSDGKLNSYYTIEYDKALKEDTFLPKFKGFPTIINEMGEAGVFAKFMFFADAGNGKIEKLNESVSINQTLDCGLVGKIDLTNQQFFTTPNTPPTIIKSTQVFSYIN